MFFPFVAPLCIDSPFNWNSERFALQPQPGLTAWAQRSRAQRWPSGRKAVVLDRSCFPTQTWAEGYFRQLRRGTANLRKESASEWRLGGLPEQPDRGQSGQSHGPGAGPPRHRGFGRRRLRDTNWEPGARARGCRERRTYRERRTRTCSRYLASSTQPREGSCLPRTRPGLKV